MSSETSAGPRAYVVFEVSKSQQYRYSLTQAEFPQTAGTQPAPWSTQDKEPKKDQRTLGALQILIGLVYIGLGSILGTILVQEYVAYSFDGGVPFWGGMWFIISGSLSVVSQEQQNSLYLTWSNIITNIVSAMISATGTGLFITEIIINSPYYSPHAEVFQFSGRATSGVLLIFSFLELWIAFTCAWFAIRQHKEFQKTPNNSKAEQVDAQQPEDSHSSDPSKVLDKSQRL